MAMRYLGPVGGGRAGRTVSKDHVGMAKAGSAQCNLCACTTQKRPLMVCSGVCAMIEPAMLHPDADGSHERNRDRCGQLVQSGGCVACAAHVSQGCDAVSLVVPSPSSAGKCWHVANILGGIGTHTTCVEMGMVDPSNW
jgi:hypothetical protein